MLTTAVLPQYLQKLVYPIPALAATTTLVPYDRRRTYLRIVTGIAGIGANAGIYLDGEADNNLFERVSATTVYEYWWEKHGNLVNSAFIVKDVTAPGIVSIHGVVCIEDYIRRIGDARQEAISKAHKTANLQLPTRQQSRSGRNSVTRQWFSSWADHLGKR